MSDIDDLLAAIDARKRKLAQVIWSAAWVALDVPSWDVIHTFPSFDAPAHAGAS